MRLLKAQDQIAKDNFNTTLFVGGVAGTGKTTAAIERIKQLIRDGAPPSSILVIVPQSALAVPYVEALRRSRVENGVDIHTATLGKLAYEMVDLFFPLIAEDIGFGNPFERPHFLSLELVQYYMTRFVEPEIDSKDYFNSVHISRNRLYTQIIDNLNKSALVNFDHTRLAEILQSAWRGGVAQNYIYEDAQASAELFRQMCLQYNMLDFSLQVELFKQLWRTEPVKNYLTQHYRHLIVDNVEEDNPTTHDILREWIPACESALVLYDSGGGYRRFLGADPIYAESLKELCNIQITLTNHRVMSSTMETLEYQIAQTLEKSLDKKPPKAEYDARDAIAYTDNRFHTQMVEWTVENIAQLIHEQGVDPGEIVILAPYLPDALRFSLQTRLDELDVPNRAHRPSRALRDEPAARTLLTLAKVAHPQWGLLASKFDVAYALTSAIADLDLIRARLLTDTVYQEGRLLPFATITNDKIQQRITFEFGLRYDAVQQWFDAYIEGEPIPIDIFFSRLFGEVLSQKGYGFHNKPDAATTSANLIDSARDFRQTVSKIEPQLDTAYEYIRMVDRGVIANQYVRGWDTEKRSAVLIAPAYTFLLSNLPVDYQFWLNVGSMGWAQRLQQPITHPYVLSRQWVEGQLWTDEHEYTVTQENLAHLALGLIRRCRQKIYLGFSEFSEQGFEQRGQMLMTFQSMLRRLQKESA